MSSARCYLLLKLSPPTPTPPPPTHFPRAPIVAACLFWEVHLFINSHTACLYHCEGEKNDPFCTPCEASVSSDVFVLVKGKKNIARNASVGVFVLQRIFVRRRGLFIVIESNWLRRRATNEVGFAELFRAGSQFVPNYVPCHAREKVVLPDHRFVRCSGFVFVCGHTLLDCSAVRNFSARDAALRSRSHFDVVFRFRRNEERVCSPLELVNPLTGHGSV